MTQDTSGEGDTFPQFLLDRGISPPIKLPSGMIGVYTFSRDDLDIPPEKRTYKRRAVLTSEGWIPPAPETVVDVVVQMGDSPNDLNGISEYTIGKGTRIAIDPTELKAQLDAEGSIISDSGTYSAARRRYSDDIKYYIPDELDAIQTATYLTPCVESALKIAERRAEDGHPSITDVVSLLVAWYDITDEVAEEAIALADLDLE